MTRAEGLLLDDADATICWNSLTGAGSGFGWDRRDGRNTEKPATPPGSHPATARAAVHDVSHLGSKWRPRRAAISAQWP